jgi:hypothetical protein
MVALNSRLTCVEGIELFRNQKQINLVSVGLFRRCSRVFLQSQIFYLVRLARVLFRLGQPPKPLVRLA